MVSTYTFPRADIALQDQSAPTVADPTVLPLHLPIFGCFAEKGPVGVPVLGGANALQQIFGTGFLDERSVYFNHPNVFIKRALPFQQVYMVRLADPAAVAATLVLTCTTTPGQIPQYQRNGDGSLLTNNGNPVPRVQSDGHTPVTEAGVTLSWGVRPLGLGETLTTCVPSSANINGQTVTTYPIMAFTTDVGAGGNLAGFRLFYDPNYDQTLAAHLGALIYSFQPVMLTPQTNIEAPIYDIYNDQTQVFAFKPGAYDASTAGYYELADQVMANFNGLPGLPYNFHVYSSNIGTMGQLVLDHSPELSALNPYQVNLFTAMDTSNNPYEHLVVDATGAQVLNANVVQYLQGGNDGALTKDMLETQTVALMSGDLFPEIADEFRFPITHFYDSGFTLANKASMMGIFGLRDDVKLELSTQDVANPPNTASQDQSAGSSLRASALLNPESLDFGTQACRVSIYQQCGLLSDTQVWNKIVPATLDRMLKRCLYNNAAFIKGEPKGRPNSEVSIFNIKSINWTPTTPQQKQLSWQTGLNYMQYCDVQTLFYPDLLSVYPIQNSLLSSDVFVDYVAVYLKKIIRRQWTIYAGRDDAPKTLYQSIEKAIDSAAAYAFNGSISTTTVVSQTAVDSALGYQTTVTTTVSGSMPNRVWKVIVPITRAA